MAALHAKNAALQNVVNFFLKTRNFCDKMFWVSKEAVMDLAHLVSAMHRKSPCNSSASHYWVPVGEAQASAGNNITLQFECKHCEKRVCEFLTREQYFLCENQLKRSQK